MFDYFEEKVAGMKFWDIGILKIYVLAIGLVGGAFFPELVKTYLWILLPVIGLSFVFLLYGLFFRDR